MKMQEASTSRVYDAWSRVYDRTFGALVQKRQLRALQQLHLRPGDAVLDVGVGTGIMLQHYPRDVTVVGMDLSAGMLAKAAQKRDELSLSHCRLVRADAMLPPFAPQSFDHIMISHTISVVSDPNKLIRWAASLVKPGGRIVLLNHFQSSRPLMAWIERMLNPLSVRVGWRCDVGLDEVLRGVDLHVTYQFQLRLFDLWQIVVLTDQKPMAPAAPQGPSEPVRGARLAVEGGR